MTLRKWMSSYCDRITRRTAASTSRAEKPDHSREYPRFKLIDIGTFGGPNDGVNGPNIPILSPSRPKAATCLARFLDRLRRRMGFGIPSPSSTVHAIAMKHSETIQPSHHPSSFAFSIMKTGCSPEEGT